MPYESIEEKIKVNGEEVDTLIVDGEAVTSLYVDKEKVQPFGIYAETTQGAYDKAYTNGNRMYYPRQYLRKLYATNVASEYNDYFYTNYDKATIVQRKYISFPDITLSIFNTECDEFKLLKKLNLQSVYLRQGYTKANNYYQVFDSSFTNFKLVENNHATILYIDFNTKGDYTASEGTLYGINQDGTTTVLDDRSCVNYIPYVFNSFIINQDESEEESTIEAYCYALNQEGKIMIIHYTMTIGDNGNYFTWEVGKFSLYLEDGRAYRSRHRTLLENTISFYPYDTDRINTTPYCNSKFRSQFTFTFDYYYNSLEKRVENSFIFINPLFCKMDD